MNTTPAPELDGILEDWRMSLGGDFAAYKNHCYRVLHFGLAFCEDATENVSKISIAAAFHDLGIWSDNTYDYIGPSIQLARAHLAETGRGAWCEEVEAMIAQHHKLTRYTASAGRLEPTPRCLFRGDRPCMPDGRTPVTL